RSVYVSARTRQGTTNTSTSTVSARGQEPRPSNNAGTATTTVNARADLSVTKSDSPDPVTAGNDLTYTIIVTNGGASDAQGVSLSDTIPANTTFVSAMQTAGPAFTPMTPAVGGTGTLQETIAA